MEICGKSYGSEGSLNQHVKLKHPEYYYANLAKAPAVTDSHGAAENVSPSPGAKQPLPQ